MSETIEWTMWAPSTKRCHACGNLFEGAVAAWTCSPGCNRKFNARWKSFSDEQRVAWAESHQDELHYELMERYRAAPLSELKLDFAETGGWVVEDALRDRGYGDWVDRCERFRAFEMRRGKGPRVSLAALAAWCE